MGLWNTLGGGGGEGGIRGGGRSMFHAPVETPVRWAAGGAGGLLACFIGGDGGDHGRLRGGGVGGIRILMSSHAIRGASGP